MVESGMYGASIAASILKGSHFNRGVQAHKILSEVLFRVQWQSFVNWLVHSEIRS